MIRPPERPAGSWENPHARPLDEKPNGFYGLGCRAAASAPQRVDPRRRLVNSLTMCLLNGLQFIRGRRNGRKKTTYI
jgi:hypothetical protein